MQAKQITLPPLSKTNKIIISILAISFIILSGARLAGVHIEAYLVLLKAKFLGYQLITYPLVETNIISLIFNGLLFWFLGSELEKSLGQKFYIKFLFITYITAGIAFLLLSFLGIGSILDSYWGTGSLMMGMLTAYAVLYGERELHFMFFFPLKAKYFCLLIAGIQLYGAFFSSNKASALAHLLSMGIAYIVLYMASYQRRQDKKQEEFKKYQRAALKKSFKLIKNDEKPSDDDPRYWQ